MTTGKGRSAQMASQTQAQWDKVWKVTRAEIDAAFVAVVSGQFSNVPAAVKEWPARGNADALGANGSALTALTSPPTNLYNYAPFVDVNSNGVYDWQMGDYPDLRGSDQMLWQMYNDAGGTKTSTGTTSILLQIGLAAWAYNRGTIADNIQVYEYTITNRGDQLDSAVATFFADLDIGLASEDYMGFDSSRRLGYLYNATASDGNGQGNSYGSQIPVAGMTFLRVVGDAPLAGVRPATGAFTYFANSGQGFPLDVAYPTNGIEFYRYMTGSTKSGSPFMRDFTGQQGVPTTGLGPGPATRYLFDGDPSVSGTWSECFSGNGPGDRRFLLSSSAFLFPANSSRTIAIALVVAPNSGGCPNVSLSGILQTVDTAIKLYDNPLPFIPNSVAQRSPESSSLRFFPNPAGNALFIVLENASAAARVEIVDVAGRTLHAPVQHTATGFRVSTTQLPAGVYAARVTDANGSASGTFVKR